MLEKRIRVLLVDDHAVVRSGLGAFMLAYDDLELVGEASSGERAITLCQQTQPDVVLMDLIMPGMDGATATRHIREKCPNIQVITLTSFKEKELVEAALQAGAIGYLLKDVSADDLVNAIRNDKPYNEVKRGVEASLATSMGRMAAHTGKIVELSDYMEHDHEFAPGLDTLTKDSPAPTRCFPAP